MVVIKMRAHTTSQMASGIASFFKQLLCLRVTMCVAAEAVSVMVSAGVCLCATFCSHASCERKDCRAHRGQSLHACTLCWTQQPCIPLQSFLSVPTFLTGLAIHKCSSPFLLPPTSPAITALLPPLTGPLCFAVCPLLLCECHSEQVASLLNY